MALAPQHVNIIFFNIKNYLEYRECFKHLGSNNREFSMTADPRHLKHSLNSLYFFLYIFLKN